MMTTHARGSCYCTVVPSKELARLALHDVGKEVSITVSHLLEKVPH